MLDKIRPWLTTHPRWTLALLLSALLGPFLAKPFNMDDPLFIWLAQQIQAHPGNPFDFNVNWYGSVAPMWAVTENPPLAGYYFAVFGTAFGWNEIALHIGGFLAALAVILGTHRLAVRLTGKPLLAACALLFAPIFLVSAGTIMSDVLMLSFWIWAVVFWLDGLEQNRPNKILFAGLLMALAILTKYFGVALVPLLAVHAAMEKRKPGIWIAALLIPLVALGTYQLITLALYGHALLFAAAGFASSVKSELGFSRSASGLVALAFTGGGAAAALFLAPSLWRMRTLAIMAGSTLIIGSAICFSGLLLPKYHALATTAARLEVSMQVVFWAIGGVLVLALATSDVLKTPSDSRSWLLALWVLGTFAFAAFTNWTVNGRSLLPLLPAVGILLARRWESGEPKRSPALLFGLAASALLAFLAAQSDFQLAIAVRRSAQEVSARYDQGQSTMWFEGHWGFQYYMQKLGALPVNYKHPKQRPGDILVVPMNNTDASEASPDIVLHHNVITLPNSSLITTWHAELGAGFYASVLGPLPFAFGDVPAEQVFVYELKSVVPEPDK